MQRGLLAIVAGTGVDLRGHHDRLDEMVERAVDTRFGRAHVVQAKLEGRPVVFLKRHARPDDPTRHDVPPHRVNYRANIAALAQMGVTAILASTAVGSLHADWPAGTLVLLDQFIDATAGRARTFYDESAVHIDCTQPYCGALRALVSRCAAAQGLALRDGATYICCDGPRFETAAEIRAYRAWGADVVGMTGVPEASLAREADIAYAGVSIVSNLAAGIAVQALSQEEVVQAMKAALPRVVQLFLAVAAHYEDDPALPSRTVMREYPHARATILAPGSSGPLSLVEPPGGSHV